MGRILQKRKNRSSAPKVKHRTQKAKNGNKKINALGNVVVADNWDRKLTLSQNYRRLGLTARLNVPTGGSEKLPGTSFTTNVAKLDPLHAHVLGQAKTKHDKSAKFQPSETRVERDPETGKILRVISGDGDDEDEDEMIDVAGRTRRKANPLDDPLEEIMDIDGAVLDGASDSAIVRQLERQVVMEEEAMKKKKPRSQSKNEIEWLERLVEKHGEDTKAMAKDKRLNRMQQTEMDIARRLKKWKKSHGQEE